MIIQYPPLHSLYPTTLTFGTIHFHPYGYGSVKKGAQLRERMMEEKSVQASVAKRVASRGCDMKFNRG